MLIRLYMQARDSCSSSSAVIPTAAS